MNRIRQQIRTLSPAAFAAAMLALLFAGLSTKAQAQIPNPSELYYFQGGSSDVCYPIGPIAQGRDGNIYGTSENLTYGGGNGCGGANNVGGVFKITPGGGESLFASVPAGFTHCGGGLILASDGNFYGTCLTGNPATGLGSIFKVTPDGVWSDFYDFTNAHGDAYPNFPPIQGVDGNLYGLTGSGSFGSAGTIYKITLSGAYSNLHTFSGGDDYPYDGNLMQASNGNLYGTIESCTEGGGFGCVFEMSTKGVYKDLYVFTGTPTRSPNSTLIQGSTGLLYGITGSGGTYGNGVIYSLTTGGKLKVVYNINASVDGDLDTILQATDGNFYGVACCGLQENAGALYELTAKKSVMSVFSLPGDGADGTQPNPLLQHTNGTLYGTTRSSDPGDYGTVFSLAINAKPFIALQFQSGTEGTSLGIFGQGFQTGPATEVSFNGKTATFEIVSDTYMTATIPADATKGYVTVTEGNETLQSNIKFTPKK